MQGTYALQLNRQNTVGNAEIGASGHKARVLPNGA
jgi:hypothetical protein